MSKFGPSNVDYMRAMWGRGQPGMFSNSMFRGTPMQRPGYMPPMQMPQTGMYRTMPYDPGTAQWMPFNSDAQMVRGAPAQMPQTGMLGGPVQNGMVPGAPAQMPQPGYMPPLQKDMMRGPRRGMLGGPVQY